MQLAILTSGNPNRLANMFQLVERPACFINQSEPRIKENSRKRGFPHRLSTIVFVLSIIHIYLLIYFYSAMHRCGADKTASIYVLKFCQDFYL